MSRGLLLFVALFFAFTSGQGIFNSKFAAAAATRKYGKIKVITYAFDNGSPIGIGNVEVHVSPVNTNVPNCPDHNGITNASGGNSVLFTSCGIQLGNTSEPYKVTFAQRSGYSFRSIHGALLDHGDGQSTDLGARFNVLDGQERTIELFFDPPPSFNPQPQQGGGGGGGGGTTAPVDNSTHKNGAIEVKSIVYESSGQTPRQGGVEIHVQAAPSNGVNYATNDVAHNCDDYNQTTDSAGGGNPTPPANYGYAHFKNCWTSADNSKTYQISYGRLPDKFDFRSFHITNGTFNTGATVVNTVQGITFTVKNGQETKLEIWLTRRVDPTQPTNPGGNPTTSSPGTTTPGSTSSPNSPNRPGSSSSSSSPSSSTSTSQSNRPVTFQVFTQQNTFYIPGRDNEPSRNLAEFLTQQITVNNAQPPACVPDEDTGETCGLACPDETDDTNPACPSYVAPDKTGPKTPTNLKHTIKDDGTPELSWDAVEGDVHDGTKEDIAYRVERITNGAAPGSEEGTWRTLTEDDIDSPVFVDDSDSSAFPAKITGALTSYTYRIYALDDAVDADDNPAPNLSAPAVQEVTLTPQPPNVAAGDEDTPDTPTELQTGTPSQGNPATPPTELQTYDGVTSASVPAGSGGAQPLSCDVVNHDNVGAATAGAIGEAQGTVSGLSCRTPDGEEVEQFDEDIEMDVDVENSLVSDDTELYGYDGTDWQEIDTEGDGSTGEDTTLGYTKAERVKGDKTTFKVRSKKPMTLAVIDKRNPAILAKAIAGTTIVLIAGGLGFLTTVVVMRRRAHQLALKPYADVDLTPMNPRVDYTPTLTAPRQQDDRDEH